LSGLEIRDWLLRLNGKEISNLYANSLSNCPKLSDEPRIKKVEYTVIERGPVSIKGQKEVSFSLRVCNLAADAENTPDPFPPKTYLRIKASGMTARLHTVQHFLMVVFAHTFIKENAVSARVE